MAAGLANVVEKKAGAKRRCEKIGVAEPSSKSLKKPKKSYRNLENADILCGVACLAAAALALVKGWLAQNMSEV